MIFKYQRYKSLDKAVTYLYKFGMIFLMLQLIVQIISDFP